MTRTKRPRKQLKSLAFDMSVYNALDDLRAYTGTPISHLINLLFEHKGLIPRTVIHNFWDDFSPQQRKFKEWKELRQQKEKDENDGHDTTSN